MGDLTFAISFLVLDGPMKGHKFIIKGGEIILIGREEGMNIYIPEDELVSRKHAIVIFDNGNYFIRDLNSTNGTYLNGEKLKRGINKDRPLKDGDVVKVGNTNLQCGISRIK